MFIKRILPFLIGFIVTTIILNIIDYNKKKAITIKERKVLFNSKLDTIIITKKDTLFLLKKEP